MITLTNVEGLGVEKTVVAIISETTSGKRINDASWIILSND